MNCPTCGIPVNVEDVETQHGTAKGLFMCIKCDFTDDGRDQLDSEGWPIGMKDADGS